MKKKIFLLALLVSCICVNAQRKYPEAATGLMPDGGLRNISYSFDTVRVFLLCADTTNADNLAAVNNWAWWLKAYKVTITEHWLYQRGDKIVTYDYPQESFYLDWYKEKLNKKYMVWMTKPE